MFFTSGFPFGDGMPMGGGRRGPIDNNKFYERLGVDKNCSIADVKKAYRKLAIRHHPDKGGDQEVFKEISRAYEVLSDEEKRKIYDEYGEEGLEGQGPAQDASDIFDLFFGGGRRQQKSGRRRGEDVVSALECTLEQMYTGAVRKMAVHKSIICQDCEGHGGPESCIQACKDCGGKGIRMMVRRVGPMITQSQAPCPTCQTTGKFMPEDKKCKACSGQGTVKERKVLEVAIDKGAPNEHKVVFTGEADERPNEIPGDVVFVLQQKQHTVFQRRGYDLFMEKTVTLYEALTGVKFALTHLDGRQLIIQTSEQIVLHPQQCLGVANEGMPVHRDPFQHGNLFIIFKIEFPLPKQITEEAKVAFKKHLPNPPRLDVSADAEAKFLEELDPKDSASRYGRRGDAVDEDEEEGPQRVQCRQQ